MSLLSTGKNFRNQINLQKGEFCLSVFEPNDPENDFRLFSPCKDSRFFFLLFSLPPFQILGFFCIGIGVKSFEKMLQGPLHRVAFP